MPLLNGLQTWPAGIFRTGLDELRVAQVRALAEMDRGFLEVRGELVLRQRRRFSDYANHPDPMLELDSAAFRVHPAGGGAPDVWEEVEQLSLNRRQVAVMIPEGEDAPGGNPRLAVEGRPVRVKLLCRSLQVTGFLRVPLRLTVPAFLHESRNRFIGIAEARVLAGPTLGEFSAVQPFCLVNRDHLVACIETRGGRES
jgi:hypothetical protein